MNTRQITYRDAGLHRVKPQVRWAWVVALSFAVVGGTCEWAVRRGSTAQSPTLPEVSSAPPNSGAADKRT